MSCLKDAKSNMAIYVNVLARVGMVVLLQSLKVKKEKLQFTFRAFLINSNSLTFHRRAI